MTEKRFVKYDGNKIVDLKYDVAWRIGIGDVDLLLKILNNEKDIDEPIKRDGQVIVNGNNDVKYCKGYYCEEYEKKEDFE